MNNCIPKILRLTTTFKILIPNRVVMVAYFQIFYMEDAGFSFTDVPVEDSIKIAMWKAIQHFKSNGLETAAVSFELIMWGFGKVIGVIGLIIMFLGSDEKYARVIGNWSVKNVHCN